MKDSITWVGLDTHADSIFVSVFGSEDQEPSQEYEVVPDDKGRIKLLKRLKALPGQVRCVYEAGVCGYEMYRFLSDHGIDCAVVAPSLIPRKAGERIKTNRRDARKLARLYRAGELTLIEVPDEKREGLRDLVRGRDDVREDVMRRRHRLSKYLLRHGHRYREGKAWTGRFWRWVDSLEMAAGAAQCVLMEYRVGLQQAMEQLQRMNKAIQEMAADAEYQETGKRYMAFRGIQTLTAMTVLGEVGSMKRYATAPCFMSAVGLVPSERSSGNKRRQGGITGAGNKHIKRVLIEASWHYRHQPRCSARLRARRKDLPAEVLAIVEKADQRLHRKFKKLINKGKPPCKAVVAVARELAGFLWAMGQVA